MSYSLKELSIGVALAAVAAGAIVYPTQLWAVGLITATVLLVVFAGLVLALTGPRQAPFLTGFVSLGAFFLLMFYGPDWLRGNLPQNLITNHASMRWASYLEESSKPQIPGAQVTRIYANGQWMNGQFLGANPSVAEWQVWQNGTAWTTTTTAPPYAGHLIDIANSLFILIVATIGGLLGRFGRRGNRAAAGCDS